MRMSSPSRRPGRARAWAWAVATTVAVVVAGHLHTAVAHAQVVLAQVRVNPTSADFPGGAMVQKMIDWTAQFGLWGSVTSLLIGAGIWGVSQQFATGSSRARARSWPPPRPNAFS